MTTESINDFFDPTIDPVAEPCKIFTTPNNTSMFTKGTKFTKSDSQHMYNNITDNWTPTIQCYDELYEYYYCLSKYPFDNNDIINPKFLKPKLNDNGNIVGVEVSDTDEGTELYVLLKSVVDFSNSNMSIKRYNLVKCRAISLSEIKKENFTTTIDNKIVYIPDNIVIDEKFAYDLSDMSLILIFLGNLSYNISFFLMLKKKRMDNDEILDIKK